TLREDGWIWAHFPLSDQRSRDFLSHVAGAPAAALSLMAGPEEGPRIQFEGEWAFGVLPDFEREFDGRSTGFGRLRFMFDSRRLFTARRHALRIVDDVRHDIQQMKMARPLDAFLALNLRYCELAEDQVEALSHDVDAIEDRVLGAQSPLEELNLGPIRRDLSRRHREVSALRTAYHRAAIRHGREAPPNLIEHLPTLLQRTEDVDREITALQDRARLIHEEIDTKITSATNRTLRALTILSTLLMPPTLIVGAFGMNVNAIPFARDGAGFWLACLLCAVTIGAAYALLLRLRVLR
ncbi:MAG: CorA family divalent cation transporter, partial [Hyphomonadaceae bacterium]